MAAISVIVPVYNTEQYLPRCLDSILSQSFTDFELLLIDDGSTDDSGTICDAYAEKDSRIRVFHKENGGVSSARNMGVDNAKGEWVFFMDSDDELIPEGLLTLVDGTSDTVDMVMAGYEVVDNEGNPSYSINKREFRVIKVADGVMEMYSPRDYRFQGYLWCKLFRHSVIKDKQIRFSQDLVFSEDRLFVTQYICSIDAIYYTTVPVYRYFERQESTMGSLKRSFNYGVATDVDARIKMKRLVNHRFDNKELGYLVDFDVYRGYRRVVGIMQEFGVEDKHLRHRLRSRCVEALGMSRFLSFEMARNKRRIEKMISKLFGKKS